MRTCFRGGAWLLLVLGACATPRGPVGSVTKVESSDGDRPEWADRVPEDDGDQMFWVGRKSGSGSEDGAVVDAREDCGRQLADYLENTATKVYEKARVETAAGQDLGGSIRPLVRDAYKAWYAKVKAQGLKTKETYTERWEKIVSADRVAYEHKAYVLMVVSKKQMIALGQAAIAEQLQ